ncbi:MAG: hypothetical protein HKN30_13500 [Sulfitobacter sp.]|nr:hypothetical protein [Sulfitobacter sp.]
MMKVVMAAALVTATASGAAAQSKKEQDCTYQAAVVSAVQQARLDRVREKNVRAHVEAAGDWPEQYNNTIPVVAGWIYSSDVKMRDLKSEDFGAAWKTACLAQ